MILGSHGNIPDTQESDAVIKESVQRTSANKKQWKVSNISGQLLNKKFLALFALHLSKGLGLRPVFTVLTGCHGSRPQQKNRSILTVNAVIGWFVVQPFGRLNKITFYWGS